MSFRSPLADPASWTLSSGPVILPAGVRYGGYPARALAASRGAAAAVQAPAPAALRKLSVPAAGADPAFEIVELQPLAFRFRPLARAFAAGVPTFYFLLPAGTAIGPANHELVAAAETIATVDAVRVVVVFPDRLVREPALTASLILEAINASGGPSADWQPFADAVQAAAGGDAAPVLLLDHRGAPVTDATVEVDLGGDTHSVTLAPEDGGDLQAAVARLNAAGTLPIANLWGGAASAVVRPGGGDIQLARLEDALRAATEIEITPAIRHVTFTDLRTWLAPQAAGPALERYTRGNRVVPLVNGPAFFDDLFQRLDEARGGANGGLHLTGWSLFHDTELVKAPAGAAADFPLTLAQAAALIGAAGGRSCFLPARFIQVDDPAGLAALETVALFTIVSINAITEAAKGKFEMDGTGLALGFAVLVANAFIISHLSNNEFRDLEPSKGAVEALNAIANAEALLSPHPLTVDDNPLANVGGILFGSAQPLFNIIRHFNVYHQKLAIVRRAAGFVGYCGGIDCNPDRLDDARHLLSAPYHDVHARVEGPAVRDLVVTFDQRWQRDGGGPAAFTPADAAAIPAAGPHVVQVARSYGVAADPARAFAFAPDGDRTLLDTLLLGIAKARELIYIEDQYLTPSAEFVEALVAKVASGGIRKLILTIPDITDQPFGEIRRTEVIALLRDAAATAGQDIVRIGSPRRRFTIPRASLRGSSGRLLLKADLANTTAIAENLALGPLERLPDVPFWLAVDGELMWVFDESAASPPAGARMFKAERGDATRILSGVGSGKGATVREHKAGTAATIVKMDGIYVHAKLMIVDDVFLSVGSANLNRRGFYSDGECNLFVVPEPLRAGPDNPVRALRKQLWAEMLDLPLGIADPLLEDPVAASALFDRSYFLGNRYVQAEAFPKHVMIRNFAGGDGLVGTILNHLGAPLLATAQIPLFNTVVDPTNATDRDA